MFSLNFASLANYKFSTIKLKEEALKKDVDTPAGLAAILGMELGDILLDTNDSQFYGYNGAAWVMLIS